MSKYWIVGLAGFTVLATGAAFTYPRWSGWFEADHADTATAPPPHTHKHEHDEEHVKLSPQARANLRLRVAKLELVQGTHWRSIRVPGQVVERPGISERLVSASVAGVVHHISAVRGESVKAGAPLFVIELVSEHLHSLQADLFKTWREQQLVQQEKDRLQDAFKSGALPAARMIEVDNQLKRLLVTVQARSSELGVRGFSTGDLEQVKQGKFVRHITVSAPPFTSEPNSQLPASLSLHPGFEVEQVKVKLGEQVQPGQPLAALADHHQLLVEGKVFSSDVAPVQQAARAGLPVRAIFAADPSSFGASAHGDLTIVNMANHVEPATQTLSFFLQLPNLSQEYFRDGKSYRLWRYRPGQRVVLEVPIEPFTNVFVVPAEAIVHEGPEVYVFREEDAEFERVKVQLVHEDPRLAILANDGSLKPGEALAMNAAVQLNWTLKAQAAKNEDHDDHHH